MYDNISLRLRRKSLSNDLAIAVGSSLSADQYSIPFLAKEIVKAFGINFEITNPLEYFTRWNDFVKQAEEAVSGKELIAFVKERTKDSKPTFTHRMIASIPISNFIDTTFDRGLYKALLEAGREPVVYDREMGQMMGSWKQSNPQNPNLFFMLPSTDRGLWKQSTIQIANVGDMLAGKDLLLMNYSAHEAESILNLSTLVAHCEKIVNFTPALQQEDYWSRLGVLIKERGPEELISKLVPYQAGGYSEWDGFIPMTPLVDILRDKRYDCFISYFSGDGDFVNRLERDLRLRDVGIWRDKRELEIGDAISTKIEEGLSESYSFAIVLSQEALNSQWVLDELRAAYSKRITGELKIFPVLHKECKIPLLLADYVYADFRDERRYEEQIGLLAQAIKNTARRAQEKK